MTTHPPERRPELARRLGMASAVALGLGSMLGAGVFVAFGPAAAVAGAGVPLALVLAGAVAWANADSSGRLAATLPTSGGAYAYGRARLSPAWGGVAGFAFLIGKTISVGAIVSTAGTYLWPAQPRVVAALAVVGLTALACAGVERSARVTTVVVGVVLTTLMAVVLAAVTAGAWLPDHEHRLADALGLGGAPASGIVGADPMGVLRGAGILFFAFAGYARIATLGEEVVAPRRTIPRAISTALAVVLVVYAAIGAALVDVLGLDAVAASTRPVAEAVAALDPSGGQVWVTAVALVAAAAALVSGLGVLLGLSRTGLAMARDGVLPRALARLDGPVGRGRPARAQLLLGGVALVGVLTLDLTRAITLSSAAVLVYYAVANAAALTLPGRARRTVPALGLLGCLLISAALLEG